jgi:crotonobetainyl-CoA:carnitine CoA-transferase CaiB-like acyl-CoA transferase
MSIAEKSLDPRAACPLDGVQAIDMSRLVSGNMVGLQLADFGAEVIKIEDPKKGDPLRAWQTDGVSVHLEGLFAQQKERRIESACAAWP